MASSDLIESPLGTPIPYVPPSRGGSIVRRRWPSVRASAARKSGLSLSTGTRSSLNGGPPSSRKSRAKSGDLKLRSVSQVQTFFKERTLSKADASIRDRTASEGHLFLKALATDAPFLETFKREPPLSKESSSSSEEYEGILDEELTGLNKKAKDLEAGGIKLSPPESELDDVCIEWAKMPFVMPSDEKVYHIRALSKKKEREDAQRDMFRSVQDKTTFASRSAAFVGSERLKNELKAMDQEMEQLLLSLKQQPPMLQTCYYHRDKENLQEFVAKKREIFFVQMSLDTKRSEIRKLEERIFQREEALRKSEEMLEEDSIEFDAFLKKNDEKMQEALKKAEKNTKLKQDKVMEIKKLNTEMGIVRAEVSKYEEQLEDCKKYKEFLVRLTPFEWFEEQAILKSEREEQRRNLASQGVTTPTEPEEEEEVTYFQHPHQLLEIYNDIEVSNLALLQQCQEIEGMLESFKTKMRDARATNDTDINSLRSQLAALQAQVRLEDEKQATLKRNASLNVEGTEHEITFEMLCTKVLSTYLSKGWKMVCRC
nr:cilia- and flagella-associated protein 100-like isoform X3 [Physcomitrium patens]|eukprot:XP_024396837.1 cilia- and flagella-associated protein 100-like isoform X3 [Physcomitrella patens]